MILVVISTTETKFRVQYILDNLDDNVFQKIYKQSNVTPCYSTNG